MKNRQAPRSAHFSPHTPIYVRSSGPGLRSTPSSSTRCVRGVGAIVGNLRFGFPEHVCEFDDRTLAHLAVAIFEMLHRGERFAFTFDAGEGLTTLWLSPDVRLRFDFKDAAPVTINSDWVLALERAARADGGLRVVEEPVGHPLSLSPVGRDLIDEVRA